MDSVAFRRFPVDLALASSILVGASSVSYFMLLALVGYTYELIFLSSLTFVAIGMLMLFFRGFRGSLVVGLLYLAVILTMFEEIFFNSALSWYGLALAFFGLVAFPLVGVLLSRRGESVRIVFELCGLVFATRIVFSPFPIRLLESAASLPVIYTLIMGAVVLYVWFRKIPLGKIGFKKGSIRLPFQILAGVSVGAVLGLVEEFILRPQPINVGSRMISNIVYIVITMMVFVGLTEELLFRGLLQSYAADLMPKWQAVHLVSLLFSLFHIGWFNPLEVVFAYGAGVIFGFLLLRTDGLTAPAVAHGFGNIVLYALA